MMNSVSSLNGLARSFGKECAPVYGERGAG
jgi:hypothetical protein